jgi:hypothetical protein
MEYIVVSMVAFVVAGLVLYSGFGLGTLLMPAFAFFFPVQVAVASTAIVHLANNVFKLTFLGRGARWRVVRNFGIPATVSAFAGAWILLSIADFDVLVSYDIAGIGCEITVVKIMMAGLILLFWAVDNISLEKRYTTDTRYVVGGGILSGFFGGLSGHQGALRSAVLSRTDLDTHQFVGTTSVCSFMVDLSRVLVYGWSFVGQDVKDIRSEVSLELILCATFAAFLGTYFSSRFIKSVTMSLVRRWVSIMLIGIAIAMGIGII